MQRFKGIMKEQGTLSPLFLYLIMIDKKLIETLVKEALGENKELFLLDLQISTDNKIKILIDGDSGVPLKECIRVSRAVEHNLDREENDFSLEVSSPNISDPITVIRQYKKNLNRTLQVVLNDDTKIEGKLIETDDKGIKLTWKAREPKPIGKGKITVTHEREIQYEEIKIAKVKITF